jgi:hypothetical protein
MASVDHSAAGPAAGFEQQRQLALVLLCEAYVRDPSVRVRLEAIEDIDIISVAPDVDARVQVKHHLDSHTLTDSAREWWRALAVWMDLEAAMGSGPLPRLHLVTTSTAGADSAASMLRSDGRDVDAAVRRLIAAAEASTAERTQVARKRFLELPPLRQLRLMGAVTVLDATVPVAGLRKRLELALGLVVPSEQSEAFLERIQGWWVARSTQLLAGAIPFVSGADLYSFVDSVRDEYRRGALAVTAELHTDPNEEQKAPLKDRRFVRQLRLVKGSDELVDLAVRHYFRAFAQRSRWVRDLEDVDGDLESYERRLYDEWEIAYVEMCDRIGPQEDDRCRGGLDLAQNLATRVRARLRELDEPVLCRGTLHGLADTLQIGWHPDFRERLEPRAQGS